MSAGRQAVIKVALHLPSSQIELPLRATIKTNSVGLTLISKGAAEFFMPAANQLTYPPFDRSGQACDQSRLAYLADASMTLIG